MAELNPLSVDCVACWRLDEELATSNAIDATGNGHTGTQTGSPAVTTGVFTGARSKDTGIDGFTIATPADFKLQEWTIVGWCKPKTDPRDESSNIFNIAYVSGGYGASWALQDYSNAGVYLGARVCVDHGGAGTFVYARSSQALTLGEWVHVMVTWDAEFLTIYVNGRPHTKTKNETGIATIPYDTGAVTLMTGCSNYSTWDLCDWAFYNTAKDDDWSYYQYNSSIRPLELDGIIPNLSGRSLLLYRADEEESGEALRDVLENGQHASAVGHPEPIIGYSNGARDCGANGKYFHTWDENDLHVDVLTAISISRPDTATNGNTFAKTNSWYLKYQFSAGICYPSFSVILSGGTVTALSTTAVAINEWHILAGTFDGSNVKVYCDGVLLKTTANTTGTTDIVYDTSHFYIGENLGYLGDLDEQSLLGPGNPGDPDYPWVADEDWFASLFPPCLTPIDPLNGAINVSRTSLIEMTLTDNSAIADGWMVEIKRGSADWEIAFVHGENPQFKTGWQGAGSSLSGTSANYTLILDCEDVFSPEALIQVRVTAVDDTDVPIELAN